jgi:hypothetical protein
MLSCWATVYRPVLSGTAGHDTAAAPEGGTGPRGATNLVEPTAGSAAFLHGKASGRINYNSPTANCTTHSEGKDQLARTEGNRRPRHTGVCEAAGPRRLGPTDNE